MRLHFNNIDLSNQSRFVALYKTINCSIRCALPVTNGIKGFLGQAVYELRICLMMITKRQMGCREIFT